MKKLFALLACLMPAYVMADELLPYDRQGRPNPDAFDWTGVAAGVKIGTLGLGADASIYLADWVNFRAGVNILSFEYRDDIEDIRFDLDMDFRSLMLLFDLYPFDNGNFRLTGGVAFQDNKFRVKATPNESEKIGDNRYTPAQIGTIRGDIEFDSVAPYFGIGFGNAVRPDTALSFSFDFGVVFQTFDVALRANGTASGTPQFEADLNSLEDDIRDEMNRFKIYPVISFGISYHF
ncbi:MAG TPA: hypothetical protein PJ991_12445 [Kiritimatiellia bacterium]|nr:hypothetical protein [Kiritimatiellia bacterium]